MKRRILAVLLAAIMVLSAVPFSVFAEDATIACPGDKEIHTKDNCSYTFYTEKKSVCDEDGYKVGICDKCGAQFIYDLVPAANTPHVFTKVNAKAPTCTAEGYNECYQCTVCKKYFDNNTADAKVKADAVITKIDHKWVMDKDCTKYVCEYGCGATTTDTKYVHETHDWVLDKFVAAPTCKDDNVATFKCNTANCTATREVKTVASKYMHTLTKVDAKKATCTADGNIEHWHCSTCNRNFNGNDADTFAEEENIVVPKAHLAGAMISQTLPTCREEGVTTYKCLVCGENYEVKTPATPDYLYWLKDDEGNYKVDENNNKILYVLAAHKYIDADSKEQTDATYPVIDNQDTTNKGKFEIATDSTGAKLIYHVYNPAADTYTAPTCENYGYTRRLCVKCGLQTNSEIKEPTGHTPLEGSEKVTTPATCLVGGLKEYTCKTCKTTVKAYIAPTGHKDVVYIGATCNADGYKFTYCSNANCTNSEGYTKKTSITVKLPDNTTKTETLDKEYSIKDGTVEFLAKNSDMDNGYHKWVEATDDNQKPVINAATCTTNGSKVKYCEICSAHKTEVILATGHDFSLTWADNIKAADRKLTNAKEYDATKVEPATCTAAGYLKVTCKNGCKAESNANMTSNGVSYKTADALGHAYVATVVLPTCIDKNADEDIDTTKGYTIDICGRCNATKDKRNNTTYALALEYTLEDARVIHNIGAKPVEEYIKGSCTVKGLDKYYCADCKTNILVIQGGTGAHLEPKDSYGNTIYITGKGPVAPTCASKGNTGSYECARCKNEVAGTPIDALVHSYTLAAAKVDSSCTAVGYYAIYKCTTNCAHKNKFYVVKEYNDDNTPKAYLLAAKTKLDEVKTNDAKMDKKAHTPSKDPVVGFAATCTAAGREDYYTCTVCSAKLLKNGSTYTVVSKDEELVIDAKGHNYAANSATNTYAPTCTDAGYKYEECSVCDFGRVVDYKKPLDHDWKLVDDDVAASCTQYGGDYYECKRTGCGEKKIEGKVAKLAHKKGDLELGYGITAHNDVVYYVCGIKEATKGAKCDKCDFTVINHINKKTIVAPTCTTAGYVVETCADPGCKAILGETKVTDPALGHTVNWIETTPATETSAGVETNTCTRCGNVETRPTAPKTTVYLDLTYANANGKEGFAESSLITVKVVLSSGKAAIRTLNYGLDYDQTKLEFVSATYSDTFSVSAINDDATNGVVKFAGMSANPVEVGDAVEIATVTFRVKGGIGATTAPFSFTADSEAYLATGVDVKVDTVLDPASITIVKLMDVYTKDAVAGTIDMQDALAIYDIIQAKGYNVAADLDKDGTVDAYDLQLFYNYFVGSMTAAEIFAAN